MGTYFQIFYNGVMIAGGIYGLLLFNNVIPEKDGKMREKIRDYKKKNKTIAIVVFVVVILIGLNGLINLR